MLCLKLFHPRCSLCFDSLVLVQHILVGPCSLRLSSNGATKHCGGGLLQSKVSERPPEKSLSSYEYCLQAALLVHTDLLLWRSEDSRWFAGHWTTLAVGASRPCGTKGQRNCSHGHKPTTTICRKATCSCAAGLV